MILPKEEPLTMEEIDRELQRRDKRVAASIISAGAIATKALRELKRMKTPVAVKQFKAIGANGRSYNGCPTCEQNCPAWYKFCPGCGSPLDWSRS